MSNIFSAIASGLTGGALGFLSGGPEGAAVGAVNGFSTAAANPAGGVNNISTSTDPTVAAQQLLDQQYENTNFQLQAEELRHQTEMQIQSQQFNDVQDEKSEQMREMNTLRSVAMKQREADDKIVKEFIKTTGGE
jgi:hypothetical protein